MAKTVTLLVKEIPQDLSRVALVGLLCERFKTWVLKAVQFLPAMRAQLMCDSVEAKLAMRRTNLFLSAVINAPFWWVAL